jgi:hypothetical protein
MSHGCIQHPVAFGNGAQSWQVTARCGARNGSRIDCNCQPTVRQRVMNYTARADSFG